MYQNQPNSVKYSKYATHIFNSLNHEVLEQDLKLNHSVSTEVPAKAISINFEWNDNKL